jgi:hypothetical protein
VSKYSEIFKEARKDVNKNTIKPEESEESVEEMVNLCIKVPLALRRHWAGESKKRGISMTEVIIEALKKRVWGTVLKGTPEWRAASIKWMWS